MDLAPPGVAYVGIEMTSHQDQNGWTSVWAMEDRFVWDISTLLPDDDPREHLSHYITFPTPDQETKHTLALKSFYSWLAVADLFRNDDSIDCVTKVDHDGYLIMTNSQRYLQRHFHPCSHAYIGRVFHAGWDHRRPFVTGLTLTCSTL